MLNGENYIYNTFTGLNGINQNELDNQNLQLQINNLNNINKLIIIITDENNMYIIPISYYYHDPIIFNIFFRHC